MNYSLIPKELRPIAEKIEAATRISESEAVTLYRATDLNALGLMANVVRQRKNGNFASYIHNRYINYSNVCVLSCQFCAFAAKKRDAHAFEHAVAEIIQSVADALPLGITEVHMVGGLHPSLKKQWYLDLLDGLRALDPQLHIKAFTAIEIRHLAERIFKMPISDTSRITQSARTGIDHWRRRGNFRCHRARPNLSRERNGRGVARRPSHLASNGRPQHLYDALRTHRNN